MLLKVVLHCSFLKLKKSFQINNLKNLNLIVKTYYKKPSDGAQDFIGRYVTLWVSKFVSNLGLVMVLMWYIHSMGLVVGGEILPTHDTGNPKGSAVGPCTMVGLCYLAVGCCYDTDHHQRTGKRTSLPTRIGLTNGGVPIPNSG